MYWYRRVTTCCDGRASLRESLTFRRFATLPTTVNQTAPRHERRLSTAFTTVGVFIPAPILLAPSLDDDTAAADDYDDAGQYLWQKIYYEYTRRGPTTSRHCVTQFPARAGLRPITFGKNPRSITGHPSSGAQCASTIARAPLTMDSEQLQVTSLGKIIPITAATAAPVRGRSCGLSLVPCREPNVANDQPKNDDSSLLGMCVRAELPCFHMDAGADNEQAQWTESPKSPTVSDRQERVCLDVPKNYSPSCVSHNGGGEWPWAILLEPWWLCM
jgi:hypothetical protein